MKFHQSFIYTCLYVFTYISGRATKNNPQITKALGIVGNELSLSCVTDGVDVETEVVMWKKGETIISVGKNQQIADDRMKITRHEPSDSQASITLLIKGLEFEDAGNYTCTKHILETSVSILNFVMVDIEGPLKQLQLREESIVIDLNTNDNPLSCFTSGNPEPNYIWEKYVPRSKPILVGNDSFIYLSANSNEVEGDYRCTASNKYGKTESRYAQVHVNRPLTIYSKQRFTSTSGKTAKLGCLIDGYPEPSSVRWDRIGKTMPNGILIKKRHLWISERKHQISMDLFINDTRPEDAGIYSCIVKDDQNRTVEVREVIFNVLYMGAISHISKSRIVDEFSYVHLKCRATGYPEPLVTWKKSKPSVRTAVTEESYQAGEASLIISNVTLQHAGIYVCVATNGFGVDKNASLQLNVKTKDVLPIPVQVFITKIRRRDVTLHWQRAHNSPVALNESYTIIYRNVKGDKSYEVSTDLESFYNSTVWFKYTLRGLSTSSDYEIYITAENKIGQRNSEPVFVTTFADDCLIALVDSAYQGIENKTINGRPCLRWDSSDVKHMLSTGHDLEFPDASMTEAANFCRNPTKDKRGPWCYIKNDGYRNTRIIEKTCSFTKCIKKHATPVVRWLWCKSYTCAFTVDLPLTEVGSVVHVSCGSSRGRQSSYNSVSSTHFTYHKTAKVFKVSMRSSRYGNFGYGYSYTNARYKCTFYVGILNGDGALMNTGQSARTTVVFQNKCVAEKSSNSAQAFIVGSSNEPTRIKSNIKKTPILKSFRRRSYYTSSGEFLTEFIVDSYTNLTLECRGSYLENHTLSVWKDETLLTSTSFYQADWSTGKPYYPSLKLSTETSRYSSRYSIRYSDDAAVITSLSVSIVFTPRMEGVYSCRLDTDPPQEKHVKILVVRTCQ